MTMLSRFAPSRLCQSCQADLLTLFTYGFARPAHQRPLLRPRQGLSPSPVGWNPFTTSPRQYSGHNSGPESTEQASEDEAFTEANQVRAELNALDQLETKIAFLAEETRSYDEVVQAWKEKRALEDLDSVAFLRGNNADLATIVRSARQLHGDFLPSGVLNDEEFKMYRRLYDDPIGKGAEDLEEEDGVIYEDESSELVDVDGEPVKYSTEPKGNLFAQDKVADDGKSKAPPVPKGIALATESSRSDISSTSIDRAQDVAQLLGGELYDAEDIADEDESLTSVPRSHHLTRAGRFATFPRTLQLPQETFTDPILKLLAGHSNKQLKEVCERTFGGPGLPDSALTPRVGRTKPQKSIPIQSSDHSMGEMEANAFLSAVMPSTYAAVTSILVETRKRLGSPWLNRLFAQKGGPRILDAGSGGAGVLAFREVLKAQWSVLHSVDKDPPPAPLGKAMVLTGSDTLRHRAAALLENTTFLPRLPDYVHVRNMATLEDERDAPERKKFDIIIATHTLWPIREDYLRKQHVQNLWSLLSDDGGVLILVEKGVPRGFEAVAGARQNLLDRHIASLNDDLTQETLEAPELLAPKQKAMILAPCPNHEPCPMYRISGVSRSRKDFCSFQQRYVRPPFLQRLLGAKDRNHDDVDFSYISVIKGEDLRPQLRSGTPAYAEGEPAEKAAFKGYEEVDIAEDQPGRVDHTRTDDPLAFLAGRLPRMVFPPLKRKGHVTLDLCTPSGKIERWTVPRSFSRQAYHDARKSEWGDLWALGAKTRVMRTLKLGGKDSKEDKKARNRNSKMTERAQEVVDRMEEDRQADRDEEEAIEEAIERDVEEAFGEAMREWEDEHANDLRLVGTSGSKTPGLSLSSGRAAKMRKKAGLNRFGGKGLSAEARAAPAVGAVV